MKGTVTQPDYTIHIQISRYEDLEWTHQHMLIRRLIPSQSITDTLLSKKQGHPEKNHECKRTEMSRVSHLESLQTTMQ